MTRALLFAVLASCGNPDESAPVCHDVFYADQDGDAFGDPQSSVEACDAPDGYSATAGDCDDSNYSVRPGADERCNGADDDCDGSIDEDAIDPSVWFRDTDGDGYGDDAQTTEGCDAPAGYASEGGDCDVTDPAIHPGADEVCDGIDNDCDRLPDEDDPGLQGDLGTWYVDADYDGFGDPEATITACDQPLGGVANNLDCNDAAAAAHPGAQEICDGIDDDCDELVDEDDDDVIGQLRYWPDDDGDGYGDTGGSVFQCFAPSGYADNNNDCDDRDAAVGHAESFYADADGDGFGGELLGATCSTGAGTVWVGGDCDDEHAEAFPGGVEICDGIDDNCDGLVDEADPAVVLATWYGDDDEDGYGEDTDTAASCVAPEGYVSAGGDCDDANDFTFPDAYELCDSIDNDCNGSVDDSIDYVDWYADADGDGYGDATDSLNDCSQPSGYVLPDDDCDDGSADVHPDAVEVCANGIDDDCDGNLDNCPIDLSTADLIVEGVEHGAMLASAFAVGDVDADGTSDLVLGAPGLFDPGTVFVLSGPSTGALTTDDTVAISATRPGSDLGSDVAAGDADGDGADDLLLGAPSVDSAYLFLGPVTADHALIDADAVLEGATRDAAGAFVDIVLEDFDADGVPDLLVGEPYGGTASKGRFYVVSGTSSGTIDLTADATYTFVGDGSSAELGRAEVGIGDANADGIGDLALSAPGAGTDGVVYVVAGGMSPGTYDVDDAPLAMLLGTSASWFGASIASADYDGDGRNDLFVGAPTTANASGHAAGAVFGYLGPLEDTIETTDAYVRWDTTVDGAFLGVAVAADGDVDGDKAPDVLMGAHVMPIDAAAQGCAFLQLGPASGFIDVSALRSFPAESLDATGYSLGFVPDWDGDEGSEVAIGSPAATAAGSELVGAVHVFFSGTLLP